MKLGVRMKKGVKCVKENVIRKKMSKRKERKKMRIKE